MIKLNLPLNNDDIESLNVGDRVLLSGYLYTARDAAHKRLLELLESGRELPIDVNGETIYYVGPSPEKPGYVVGPAGPTSSYRMDKYTPTLLNMGLKCSIGKGSRSKEVIDSIKDNHAVYFAAIGGCAALISKSIVRSELICFEDLGTEAIRKFKVIDFPVIVAVDCRGNNIYD